MLNQSPQQPDDIAASPNAGAGAGAGDAQHVVKAKNLSKHFGNRLILDQIDFSIQAGESVALLGESGAGKSTLLNILAGLEPADSGSLVVTGDRLSPGPHDPDASAAMRRRAIGFVFQAFHLLPHLSVSQNVALPLLLNGGSPGSAKATVKHMLERVGLAGRDHDRPAQLSGGEQQRVSLARALVHQPSLLLADEPTGNLDPQTASQALSLMREVIEQTGCALLMVTHSDHAASICDSQVWLRRGKITSGR